MTREEVYRSIASKAVSQRFYERLLERLSEVSEDVANGFLDRFADCKDTTDVIMFLEDGDELFYTK